MSELSVIRTERKFVIGKKQAESMYLRLRQAVPGDPYAGYDPYYVRSLYFDSYYNDDYFDKLDGIRERKKIRIRIYDGSTSVIKLELKQKTGDAQLKRSFTITKEQAEDMMAGKYGFLLESGSPGMEQVYAIMSPRIYRPKCVIEYQRRAFAIPTNDIRITFDTDIRTSEGNLDLFADRSSYRPADIEDMVVLEVKYNHFLLSYIKDILALSELDERSYSKYMVGRLQLF